MRVLRRLFALILAFVFVAVAFAFIDDVVYATIFLAIALFFFGRFRKLKPAAEEEYEEYDEYDEEEDEEPVYRQNVQKPVKMGLVDRLLLSHIESMSNSQTPTYNATPYVTQTRSAQANDAAARRKADEERVRREREEDARKADYWEQEYRRLLVYDPQCRDERTKVADYNRGYFRARSQGRR